MSIPVSVNFILFWGLTDRLPYLFDRFSESRVTKVVLKISFIFSSKSIASTEGLESEPESFSLTSSYLRNSLILVSI